MGSLARSRTSVNTTYSNESRWSTKQKHLGPNIDRNIAAFIPSQDQSATPYAATDFSNVLKQACSSHRNLTPASGELKVAKCIVIGDLAVGKTALVHRYCCGNFIRDYKATIGVDFEVERFEILGISFNLQIWDTAGQERFRSIATAYYRGADGKNKRHKESAPLQKNSLSRQHVTESACYKPTVVLIVFDMSDPTTLKNCQRWYADACASQVHEQKPIVFLVGTKTDLCNADTYRRVRSHAVELSSVIGAELWTVSSKTGDHIEQLFKRIAVLSFSSCIAKDISSLTMSPSSSTPVESLPAFNVMHLLSAAQLQAAGQPIRLKKSDFRHRLSKGARALCQRLS